MLPAGQTTVTLKANATKTCTLAEELATNTHAVRATARESVGKKRAGAKRRPSPAPLAKKQAKPK